MQEHEDNARQAQLREAAEALVGWIHARRATWSTSEPLETAPPPVFTAPSPVLADAPVFTPPPLPESPVAFDVAGVFDVEPAVAERAFGQATLAPPTVAEPATPVVRLRIAPAAVRSLAASLVRGAVRVAPAAAVVAVLAGAGWLARPYVGNVKTWLTELADKATAPKPEPAAPQPAPPAGARRTGQLMARSDPAGAKVLVDGRERGVTPLTLDDVTLGSHTVVLRSDKGSVRRTVTVAADRAALVTESIFAGWLIVFAPFELQIAEGTRAIRLDENGKVLLPPGPHELRLENRDLGYRETRRVEVQPGQTTSLSLVAPPSTLSVTASAPAVVSIDGQQVGETPLTNQPIALGTRDIVVKGADGTARRFTKKVTVAPVQIDVDFSKP